jgi:hypothetical protein
MNVKARVVLASVLLLFGAACGESRDDATPAVSSADVAASGESDVHPDAGAPAEAIAGPIDPSKAKAFLTFQEKLIPLLQSSGKDGDGLDESLQKGELEALDKVRAELGLSQYEVTSLSEIEAALFARGSGEAMVAQIAELEKSLDGLPAEQRGEAEKALREMREMKANIVDVKEARAKYGDAIVDAMLALEPELRSQFRGIVGLR